ncbi:preprotein translocase subunit SecG [Eubacterium sp.]|uniref:preprotein translocase subunit SecG n=1 Tax=Eubacterium sp. TaxID=142586 RepID=UPI0015BF3162|nr:preprotein translocase subunit SecG [uncultured Eubacterium sp.]MDD5836783.1 preprotein translocase subunit SecG [Eubacteriales bacterium]
MLWYHYVFGAVLIVASIIITVVVLMQEGRSSNLSGVIGGNTESYGGKTKGMTNEKKLERVTKWFIAIFFVIVLAAFLVFLFV